MKVLIIDDDQEDAMFLSDVIKELSPETICFKSHDFQSARLVIDEEDELDFIFLDAMMYPIGGKETLMLLSQIQKLGNTKIIVNSGVMTQSKVDEFIDLGADIVLQKPSDYRTLSLTVEEIITGN
jgi:DNA-binding response OmpR family regulator